MPTRDARDADAPCRRAMPMRTAGSGEAEDHAGWDSELAAENEAYEKRIAKVMRTLTLFMMSPLMQAALSQGPTDRKSVV